MAKEIYNICTTIQTHTPLYFSRAEKIGKSLKEMSSNFMHFLFFLSPSTFLSRLKMLYGNFNFCTEIL